MQLRDYFSTFSDNLNEHQKSSTLIELTLFEEFSIQPNRYLLLTKLFPTFSNHEICQLNLCLKRLFK